jgi:hypothetical protein
MENINSKSLNIPRPVLKRQQAGLYIPRPELKRQTAGIHMFHKIENIPKPILKRQTNEVVDEEGGLPIFYNFYDDCNFSTITIYKNVETNHNVSSMDIFLGK